MPFIRPPDFAPIAAALVALAGGGQAGATLLKYGSNVLTTVAAPADSVILPPAVGSARVVSVDNLGANSANVFPNVGEAIALAGVNAAVACPSNRTTVFVDIGIGQWSDPRNV